jgi:hypothetical protein
MSEEKVKTEEYVVSGDRLVGKVRELLHEGNIRSLVIKNEEGQTLIKVPLTVGVMGAMVAPVFAALGAMAALAARLTIVVEKIQEDK